MKMHVLKYINGAVQSLSACSDPEIHHDSTVVYGEKMNSPYVSHRAVSYDSSPVSEGVLVARSRRYGLLISPTPLKKLAEKYGAESMREAWKCCVPSSFWHVCRWEGGMVPRSLLEPVLGRASEMGLRLGEAFNNPIMRAYAVMPVLSGWHYRRPVYELAQPYTAPPVSRFYEIHGEQRAVQGHLIVLAGMDDLPSSMPAIGPGQWLFNHLVASSSTSTDVEDEKREPAQPVAVIYNGRAVAAVRAYPPVRLQSPDHEEVIVDGAARYVLLHPFPEDGVD